MKLNRQHGCYQLPDADRVKGVTLERRQTPEASTVTIQYQNGTAGWCKVRMSFLDAQYLLNGLEQMSLDSGWDHLRHPQQKEPSPEP